MIQVILELIETKYEKSLAVKNQEYEKSCTLRDSETNLLRKIYSTLNTKDEEDVNIYQIDNIIYDYLDKEYNFTYEKILKGMNEGMNTESFIREIKLGIIGI